MSVEGMTRLTFGRCDTTGAGAQLIVTLRAHLGEGGRFIKIGRHSYIGLLLKEKK